jgi:hypothetical protein
METDIEGLDARCAHMPITMTSTALTWLAVHGNLYLALRQQQNRGPSTQLVRDFLQRLDGELVESGLVTQEVVDEARRTR